MKVVLFDIDGTLINSGGAGRIAMRNGFKAVVGRDDVFNFSLGGMTDRGILRKALVNADLEPEDALMDTILNAYLDLLAQEVRVAEDFRVFESARVLAKVLKKADFAVGLGTGNVERGARIKLDRPGLSQEFSFGGFGCDHEMRPNLIQAGLDRGREILGNPHAQGVIIGDTPLDILAAHSIGAECIAVATGGFRLEQLAEHQPELVVSDLSDPRVQEFFGLV